MRKIAYTLFVATFLSLYAQAQPAAVQKAQNATFTLTTYDQQGNTLATSQGVFVGTNGEAVSTWKPFVGAYRATATDAKGKPYEVQALMGANELYDICRFKVAGTPTTAPLATSAANTQEQVWAVPCTKDKAACITLKVDGKETFMEQYTYYILNQTTPVELSGCPVVTQKGQVVGIVQQSATTTTCHATDINYARSFTVNGLSANDPTLNQSHIRIDLPQEQAQATVMLMMAKEQGDSLKYIQYIDAFTQQFPQAIDGYAARAQEEMKGGQFAQAAATMDYAIKHLKKPEEAHAEYAKLIWQKEMYMPTAPYEPWTLQKALSEAEAAYALSPQPAYRHQQAQILYSMKEYQQAYDIFTELTSTDFSNEELFFEAAQCKMQLQAPKEEVIALLDKAVAACPQPLTYLSAPYLLARGQAYDEAGQYRMALQDYNRYDSLMYNRASHDFYYLRFKCETQVKQYQQALNDIAHAVVLNPAAPLYYAEMASLQLRVGRFEDAIKTCDLCMRVDSEFPDIHLIKGLALINSGQKAEGLASLGKAKELGDERAQPLIDKHK